MIRDFNKKLMSKSDAKAGFSIIEVLIALFVLTMGVLATITLTVNSIRQTGSSRDSIIASAFAIEGVELARSVRDENATRRYVDETTELFRYFDEEDTPCAIDQASAFDIRTGGDPFKCGSSENFNLSLDGNGLYNHGASSSKFKRSVHFTNSVPNLDATLPYGTTKSIDVITTVTWNNEPLPAPGARCSSGNSCVRNETTLTAWILH